MNCRFIHVLLVSSAMLATGCLDVLDFEGTWSGPRVGDNELLKRGFADDAAAVFQIDDIDLRSLDARLTIDGLFQDAPVAPIPGAEADVLASMSFDGSPARVFIAFVQTMDGGGDATVMVALYDDPRVVVRVMRGGTSPLYGIFSLRRGGSNQRVSATSQDMCIERTATRPSITRSSPRRKRGTAHTRQIPSAPTATDGTVLYVRRPRERGRKPGFDRRGRPQPPGEVTK